LRLEETRAGARTGASHEAGPDSGRWREVLFLALVVALALAVRLSNLPFHQARLLNSDAALFLAEARTQLAGGPPLDPLWPPIYPLAAAALARGQNGLEASAVTLALLAGALGPVAVFALGKPLLGVPAACFGALGSAVLFPLAFWSCQAYPETLFILCLYLLLAFFLAPGPRALALRYAGCGALAGAAYLVRPEGFALLPLLAAWLAFDPERGLDRRQRALALGLLSAGFLVVAGPYLLRLRAELGHWAISGKAGWNLQVGDRVLGQDYDRLAWGLTPDGKEVASARAMRELTLGRVLQDRPEELWRRYRVNARALASTLLDSLGLAAAALAVLGALSLAARPGAVLYLATAAAPLAALPLFFVNQRFVSFALPALLLLAGAGIEAVARVARAERSRRLLRVVLTVAALLGHVQLDAAVAGQARAAQGSFRQGEEYRIVGEWMRQHCPPGSRTTNVWVAFHSGLQPVQLPLAAYPRTLAYLRSRGCDYLVVDRRNAEKGWLPESSPVFSFLLAARATPALRLEARGLRLEEGLASPVKSSRLAAKIGDSSSAQTPPPELEEVIRWTGRPEFEVRVYRLLGTPARSEALDERSRPK
jgi:hypothetical protein